MLTLHKQLFSRLATLELAMKMGSYQFLVCVDMSRFGQSAILINFAENQIGVMRPRLAAQCAKLAGGTM